MTEMISMLLTRNLYEVFAERDPEKRMSALRQIWAPDGIFSDPQGRFVGLEEVDKAIGVLLAQFPDFVFSEIGESQSLQDAGRLAWGFGLPGQPPAVTGLDVIVVADDRIQALYTFLDGN
jgi:hypothetical protein